MPIPFPQRFAFRQTFSTLFIRFAQQASRFANIEQYLNITTQTANLRRWPYFTREINNGALTFVSRRSYPVPSIPARIRTQPVES
jgi:hypothetical protein